MKIIMPTDKHIEKAQNDFIYLCNSSLPNDTPFSTNVINKRTQFYIKILNYFGKLIFNDDLANIKHVDIALLNKLQQQNTNITGSLDFHITQNDPYLLKYLDLLSIAYNPLLQGTPACITLNTEAKLKINKLYSKLHNTYMQLVTKENTDIPFVQKQIRQLSKDITSFLNLYTEANHKFFEIQIGTSFFTSNYSLEEMFGILYHEFMHYYSNAISRDLKVYSDILFQELRDFSLMFSDKTKKINKNDFRLQISLIFERLNNLLGTYSNIIADGIENERLFDLVDKYNILLKLPDSAITLNELKKIKVVDDKLTRHEFLYPEKNGMIEAFNYSYESLLHRMYEILKESDEQMQLQQNKQQQNSQQNNQQNNQNQQNQQNQQNSQQNQNGQGQQSNQQNNQTQQNQQSQQNQQNSQQNQNGQGQQSNQQTQQNNGSNQNAQNTQNSQNASGSGGLGNKITNAFPDIQDTGKITSNISNMIRDVLNKIADTYSDDMLKDALNELQTASENANIDIESKIQDDTQEKQEVSANIKRKIKQESNKTAGLGTSFIDEQLYLNEKILKSKKQNDVYKKIMNSIATKIIRLKTDDIMKDYRNILRPPVPIKEGFFDFSFNGSSSTLAYPYEHIGNRQTEQIPLFHFLIAYDTSASISKEELYMFLENTVNLLNLIKKQFQDAKVYLSFVNIDTSLKRMEFVYLDFMKDTNTKIQNKIKKVFTNIKGGGGTSFSPLFKQILPDKTKSKTLPKIPLTTNNMSIKIATELKEIETLMKTASIDKTKVYEQIINKYFNIDKLDAILFYSDFENSSSDNEMLLEKNEKDLKKLSEKLYCISTVDFSSENIGEEKFIGFKPLTKYNIFFDNLYNINDFNPDVDEYLDYDKEINATL